MIGHSQSNLIIINSKEVIAGLLIKNDHACIVLKPVIPKTIFAYQLLIKKEE
jgi:hypothetical protein